MEPCCHHCSTATPPTAAAAPSPASPSAEAPRNLRRDNPRFCGTFNVAAGMDASFDSDVCSAFRCGFVGSSCISMSMSFSLNLFESGFQILEETRYILSHQLYYVKSCFLRL